MTDSALLKVERATKHVGELNELLGKKRPFTFVVKTDTQTGQRSAFTKKNKPAVDEIAIICGDVIHNLRSALDHVYWEIVSPHCTSDKERKAVQFPITSKANMLCKTLHDARAQSAGTGFYAALRKLRPHGETGGDEMLFLIREAANLDKHRLLIPSIDYTKIDGSIFAAALPDIRGFNVGAGLTMMMSNSTLNWIDHAVPPDMLGQIVPPSFHIYEREVNLPMEIILQIGQLGRVYPLIATLNQMIDAVRETVMILREAAALP
jgi:hypothetical protein